MRSTLWPLFYHSKDGFGKIIDLGGGDELQRIDEIEEPAVIEGEETASAENVDASADTTQAGTSAPSTEQTDDENSSSDE